MTNHHHLSTIRTRLNVLVTLGTVLVISGVYSTLRILYSVFARYMYVEDLGLDEATIHAVTKLTTTDRGILLVNGVFVLIGLIAIGSAIIRRRSSTDA